MNKLNKTQKSLLNSMINDEKKCDKKLYSAGPYWSYKTKKILHWLNKKGIKNFRGLHSGVGTSYTDNLVFDFRNELGFKGRIASQFTYLPIIKKIFENQLKVTLDYIKESLKYQSIIFQNNEKVKLLTSKYKINDSVNFGCESKFKTENNEYSCHYIDLCERLDFINKYFDYKSISTFFEIGGGFGANIHILLNNFTNIKKIIYLDIIPNLFVGTEYLRYFYGNSVKDYEALKKNENIRFSNNNDLEIFCIAPWQIEKLHVSIDHFHNASSFQEMPERVAENYVKHINRLLKKDGSISLYCYGSYELNKTLGPLTLNKLFNNILTIKKHHEIFDVDKTNYYLLNLKN